MEQAVTPAQIHAARNGNEAALAAIIAKSMPMIRGYSRKAVSPGLDFEDAMQEGLIGLFAAIEHYDPEKTAAFPTYAATCVYNAIFSAKRAAGRKKHAPLNQSVPLPESQSIPGPEDEAIASEMASITMERVKTRLSALEKQVLRLHLKGYTYSEIAVRLGKGTKTVDNALARIRRKLR